MEEEAWKNMFRRILLKVIPGDTGDCYLKDGIQRVIVGRRLRERYLVTVSWRNIL